MGLNRPILSVCVATPLRKTFDYIPPDELPMAGLQKGLRVRVPFQNRELIGVIMDVMEGQGDTRKLKQALQILDQQPLLPADIFDLCIWAGAYYHHPIGLVFDTALPVLLRQGKPSELKLPQKIVPTESGLVLDLDSIKRSIKQREFIAYLQVHQQGIAKKSLKNFGITSITLKKMLENDWVREVEGEVQENISIDDCTWPLALNTDQQNAVTEILKQKHFSVALLDGVTGSGKTEVYLQVITEKIKQGLQILVLVPEIGLTPQTIARFQQRFPVQVIALHSGLNDNERLQAWLKAANGQAKIIIGTRSAIFTPFKHLDLIIVDEEHDLSFKQQEGFRYHARDLAIKRAQLLDIPIVLGSATPALETLQNALDQRYHHLRLPNRAGGASQPRFGVLDIRNKYLEEGLSEELIHLMREHLARQEQVMIFINRRGFSPVLMCHACGWFAICKRCDARMTYHHELKKLQCHHCDAKMMMPKKCLQCSATSLQTIGVGTERLALALQKLFKSVPIVRIDRDTTQRKGSIDNLLQQVNDNVFQILIGTQMLAKGHHFPNVTLVCIIDADGGFFSSDFRAVERTGQLILQVAGRAGRAEKPGAVLLQTHHPTHPMIMKLSTESYFAFAKDILLERQQTQLPPFGFLALIRAQAHSYHDASNFLSHCKRIMPDSSQVSIWGPVAALNPKRAGKYRLQLLIQSKSRQKLHQFISKLLPVIDKLPCRNKVRWSLDIDPLDFS